MTLAVHAILNESMVPMLQSLSAILDKAIAYAEQKKIDAVVLPNARLAPNMFPLTRQVQTACDTLKNAAACLAGRELSTWGVLISMVSRLIKPRFRMIRRSVTAISVVQRLIAAFRMHNAPNKTRSSIY
jgi:hypothetical protein